MNKQDELKQALNFLVESATRTDAMAKEVLALTRAVEELRAHVMSELSRSEINVDKLIKRKLDKSNVTRATLIAYMKDHNMLKGE